MPYFETVSWEDRATLGSDLSAGGTSGEEGEVERFPFPVFNLFPGPQSDKPRGFGGRAPESNPEAVPGPKGKAQGFSLLELLVATTHHQLFATADLLDFGEPTPFAIQLTCRTAVRFVITANDGVV